MDTTPLRTLRTARKDSCSMLGRAIGLHKGAVSRMERGITKPSVRVLVAVADHYALTDAELGALVRDVNASDTGAGVGRPSSSSSSSSPEAS